jgi:hypothetical protein
LNFLAAPRLWETWAAGSRSGVSGPRKATTRFKRERLLALTETGMDDAKPEAAPPKPDAALKRIDRLVGTWRLRGRSLGSDQYTITGTTTFKWLYGGFFLVQDMDMDYAGTAIKSHELIGYDPKSKTFASTVFSNMAPDPWPYQWDIDGDDITISIVKPPMDATFKGKFAADGKSWSGGWRPNTGADETINAPYDIIVSRVET